MKSTTSSTGNRPHHALGPVAGFLADDHGRLDALLRGAIAKPGTIDTAAHAPFRAGLLKHIGMSRLLPTMARAPW